MVVLLRQVGIDSYFREAQTMFASNNPYVVPISCAFQTDDMICLAMKYYKNKSLQDRITLSPLTPGEVIRVGIGILTGLAHIHTNKFIHFDIKPSNVLFSDTDLPMIADFGQTRSSGPTGVVARPGMYPDGMPPECWRGIGTFQSDIYQVGLTLYRAANGDSHFNPQRPADDSELRERTELGKYPDKSKFLPHVPKGIKRVIRAALAIQPGDRYQTPGAFADALGRVEVGLDWSADVAADGSVTWRATRTGQPDLVVILTGSGRRWGFEIYTESAQRRRFMSDRWESGITRSQAIEKLKPIFDQLG